MLLGVQNIHNLTMKGQAASPLISLLFTVNCCAETKVDTRYNGTKLHSSCGIDGLGKTLRNHDPFTQNNPQAFSAGSSMQGLFSTSLKKHGLTQKSVVRVYFRYMHTAFMFEEKEET